MKGTQRTNTYLSINSDKMIGNGNKKVKKKTKEEEKKKEKKKRNCMRSDAKKKKNEVVYATKRYAMCKIHLDSERFTKNSKHEIG